jgi:hypothetical protein
MHLPTKVENFVKHIISMANKVQNVIIQSQIPKSIMDNVAFVFKLCIVIEFTVYLWNKIVGGN